MPGCRGEASEDTKVLLKCAVCSFRLSVSLRMVGCRETECRASKFKELFPEGREEAWVTIADDRTRETMETDNSIMEELCEGGSVS